jgi:hypothetical protein
LGQAEKEDERDGRVHKGQVLLKFLLPAVGELVAQRLRRLEPRVGESAKRCTQAGSVVCAWPLEWNTHPWQLLPVSSCWATFEGRKPRELEASHG